MVNEKEEKDYNFTCNPNDLECVEYKKKIVAPHDKSEEKDIEVF